MLVLAFVALALFVHVLFVDVASFHFAWIGRMSPILVQSVTIKWQRKNTTFNWTEKEQHSIEQKKAFVWALKA